MALVGRQGLHAAATSKAPGVLNSVREELRLKIHRAQELRFAKVSYSIGKNLCGVWPFLLLQEPRAQGWSVRAICCLT